MKKQRKIATIARLTGFTKNYVNRVLYPEDFTDNVIAGGWEDYTKVRQISEAIDETEKEIKNETRRVPKT